MTLLNSIIGQIYIVKDAKLSPTVGHRLEALGLTIGTKITVLNCKKDGAVIILVRGTRIAVGKEIADAIFVEEVTR